MRPPHLQVRHIRGFDGLRAFSILLVLLTHLGVWDNTTTGSVSAFLSPLFFKSSGVYIFFAISGFLITMILLNEKKKTGDLNFRRFYYRRFLKLLPPIAIFYIALCLLMAFHFLTANYFPVLLSLCYVYNFVPIKFQTPELGHTWSLSVEEQFYLFWPVVIFFFSNRKALLISGIVIVACMIAPFLYQAIRIPYHGSVYAIDQLFRNPTRFFIPAIAPIIIGCICSILVNQQWISQVHNPVLISGALLFLVISVLLPESFFSIIPDSITKGIAASLLLSYLYLNQQSRLTGFLESKPLVYIGKLSYGIYIWQGLFLRNGPGGELLIQKFPINILLSLLVACLSYELIEKPIQVYKSRF